jgi:vacuolar-type H+-ATPase subunit H
MDDHEVLQHLLNLESKAATLVNDAQVEADRRVTSGEQQNRAHYDEVYSAEVAELEASYSQNIARVKEDYRRQLDGYLEGLRSLPLDKAAFSSLAEKLLFNGDAVKITVTE